MNVAAIILTISVFLFSTILLRIASKALERFRERYGIREVREIGDLLLALETSSSWVAGASLGVVAAVPLTVFIGWGASVAFFFALFFAVPFVVSRHKRNWLSSLEAQLADELQTLASALRVGLSLPSAFEQLADDCREPLRKELAVVVREGKLGLSLDESLQNFSHRIPSEDVELVVSSLVLARRLGGNLSEVLETIAATTRERLKIGGKIRALTAQGRMQAWIIAGLPFCLGLAMFVIRPDLIEPMAAHPVGWALAACIVCMEAVGLFLIRRIVEIRV